MEKYLNRCLKYIGITQFKKVKLLKKKPDDADDGCIGWSKATPPVLQVWLDPDLNGVKLKKTIAHEFSHGILYPLADWALANADKKHKEYTTDLEEVVCDHLEEILYKLLPPLPTK